ncbi:MAG: hypothetical protein Q9183_002040 [Haloplaca sp. 2 TL-2023]
MSIMMIPGNQLNNPSVEEKAAITSCGVPERFNASEAFANHLVVLFAVPGAFTPGCSVNHLPGFINKLAEIRAKGVDLVCVVAFNDAFVMNAWAKANGIKEEIVGSVLHTKKTVD